MFLQAMIQQRSDFCPHCMNPKQVQIAHYENGVAVMWKLCTIAEYRTVHQGTDALEAVWCAGCGTLFHPSSI